MTLVLINGERACCLKPKLLLTDLLLNWHRVNGTRKPAIVCYKNFKINCEINQIMAVTVGSSESKKNFESKESLWICAL